MSDISKLEKLLVDIVDKKYVSSELCDRLVYSKDYSIEGIADDYIPDIIVKPGTADEVVEVVKIANHQNVPIYTWGGGTSMSGNPLAVERGIVLDMKRLNQVLEVDADNLTITAQAGTIIENIYNAALDEGVFFAHHPESSLSSTIGGALSCMGISIYGAKYGYVYDQVLAMEVILSSGKKIRIGGKSYLSLPTQETPFFFRCPLPTNFCLADYYIPSLHKSVEIAACCRLCEPYKHRIRTAAVRTMHISPQNSTVPHGNRNISLNDHS